MLRLNGNTIYLTQGDTLDLQVRLYDHDGYEYFPQEGETVRFAMKRKFSDEEPLIVKEIPIDMLRLRIEAEETKQLPAARMPYVYDIEITFPDGTVDTFIDRQRIYITEEVF